MDIQPLRIFQTTEADALRAAQKFYDSIFRPELELAIFFCSSHYDLEILGREIHRLFSGIQVIGCTTSGEIGPHGYQHSGLVAVGFPKTSCMAVSDMLFDLQQFDIPKSYTFTQSLLQRLECKATEAKPDNCFALLLIDGLSVREEIVSHTFQLGLNKIPLVGGSAGDDQRFSHTHVYHDGRFHSDSAVLAIIHTPLPFKIFRTQHLVSTEKRMVVTQADTAKRVVNEIDGLLAADAYARAIGVSILELTPEIFAANPVVVLIDGQEYVRSIQKLNDDASLTFYCAIDEGLVLRIAKCGDIKATLENMMEEIHAELGCPQVLLTFDCIHRKLEVSQTGKVKEIEKIFTDNHAVGFCTYGEQLKGVHLNQTMTGVAIGGGMT